MAKGAREAFAFFSETWTAEQSAGLVANIEAESGFNIGAVGDGGTAYGLCQWHPARQRDFQVKYRKDIRESSFEDQLRFVNFELLEGKEQAAGKLLGKAKTAQEAGEIVSSHYERPEDSDGHVRRHRGERGAELLARFSAAMAGAAS